MRCQVRLTWSMARQFGSWTSSTCDSAVNWLMPKALASLQSKAAKTEARKLSALLFGYTRGAIARPHEKLKQQLLEHLSTNPQNQKARPR